MLFTNQYKKYSQSFVPFIQSEKTKNYSTVIFFFLVLSVFGWYAIRPTVQTILYLQREITDKTETDKKMDEKIAALIEANSAYENAQNLLPALSEAIPPSAEALDLVGQIQRLAANKGVWITAVQMSNVPLASGSAEGVNQGKKRADLPIIFTVEGAYLSVIEFLQGLISMRRLVTIHTLSLSPAKSVSQAATTSARPSLVKAAVTMTAYYETQ